MNKYRWKHLSVESVPADTDLCVTSLTALCAVARIGREERDQHGLTELALSKAQRELERLTTYVTEVQRARDEAQGRLRRLEERTKQVVAMFSRD